MNEKVEIYEVIRSFLASDLGKEIENQTSLIGAETIFQKAEDILLHYPDRDLITMIKDPLRVARYAGCMWHLREVKLIETGAWFGHKHATGDLPKEWCQGSIVDTACEVAKHKEMELKSIKKLKSMISIIDIILNYFPPILVSGGTVRKASNARRLVFDVDDGSHRCIAAALSGKTTINAYIGTSL